MAPVKFDDISKTAKEVISDDFQTSGFQFKAKQKTTFDDAVITSAVDLFPEKDMVKTPAKLTWKLPKPLGIDGLCIDKLEMDKGGKLKLEASTSKLQPDLKVEFKSDLADAAKITVGGTFTGVKDTQFKFETKATNPSDFVAEVTRTFGTATLGVKCGLANLTAPDVGLRVLQGPFFCSVLATEKFGAFTGHAFYKVRDDLKAAATYEHGGKKNGNFSVGIGYDVVKGTKLKAKVQQDQSISVSAKHEVAKGFTVTAGGCYKVQNGGLTYGCQLSIE